MILRTMALLAAATAMSVVPAKAHFGLILPEKTMIAQSDGRDLSLSLAFFHPFELVGMDLDQPVSVTVHHGDESEDLTGSIAAAQLFDHAGFTLDYQLGRPGTYVFAMEPEPYWEPAEDAFIIHYTKTYVSAFDDDSGWDQELGLKTEIVPLSKPFGLWAGNVFQGIVKIDGAPVPFAEVEVEHYNTGGISAPSELMITQTIKADQNGVFTYAAPSAGWWGFAALSTADYTLEHEGSAKDVELGAVIWVHFEEWE